MFKESIKMSWRNIINNKIRSFLTVLGILIGVASVIALISIVEGVTNDLTNQVMDMGAKKVTVQVMGTTLKQGLLASDVEELGKIENISGISPSINGKSSIVYKGNIMEDISIQGKDQVHFSNSDDLMNFGREINILDVKNKNRVCLVGQDIVDEIFPTETPIDKEIIINGITHTIIGTLQESSDFSAGSSDATVIIPYTTAMSLLDIGYISSLDIYIDDETLSDVTTTEIENTLLSAFNDNDAGFTITNMQNILDTVDNMTGMLSLLLAGIAGISLIVGGIGIMNMMLVTVTERTSEIGLRKALGAKPSDIQMQFVLEALFLSLFGGVLGLIFGIVVTFVGCLAIGVEFIIVSYAIPLAIGFAAFIGLVFGYAPAKKASKLNPIDALRSA